MHIFRREITTKLSMDETKLLLSTNEEFSGSIENKYFKIVEKRLISNRFLFPIITGVFRTDEYAFGGKSVLFNCSG